MILMKQIILSLAVLFVLIGTATAHTTKMNQSRSDEGTVDPKKNEPGSSASPDRLRARGH